MFNKDLTGEKICLNCGNFINYPVAGTSGISCKKDYKKSNCGMDKACEDFEEKK